jgi:addiction module HigA family antidote
MSTEKTIELKRNPSRPPTHPGALLREDILPALKLSVTETARRLHVSRQTLHDLLAERKTFTPKMALRVGKLAGNGPALWLRMQQDYDLWYAERSHAAELKTIRTAA